MSFHARWEVEYTISEYDSYRQRIQRPKTIPYSKLPLPRGSTVSMKVGSLRGMLRCSCNFVPCLPARIVSACRLTVSLWGYTPCRPN